MDVKCVPAPLHPLFHHLTCARAATWEVLRVSDCPPKSCWFFMFPFSAWSSSSAPGSGILSPSGGFPPFQNRLSVQTDTNTSHRKCVRDCSGLSLLLQDYWSPKGTPGAVSPPSWQVPLVLQCFLSITAGSSSSLHTQNLLLIPLPRFSPCPCLLLPFIFISVPRLSLEV